ncbi:unnamed protein product [Staurois parvus]|uniref:Uncharacterized protein n=1 Tax=Staurois parvus TaxID=386267 RepID=A0ABN9BHF2_9NEOB|nr:unnamed protein product [Staurois parvus]
MGVLLQIECGLEGVLKQENSSSRKTQQQEVLLHAGQTASKHPGKPLTCLSPTPCTFI